MNKLNIYKISQEVNNGWDTFDSAVVVAESEEQAKLVYPCPIVSKEGKTLLITEYELSYYDWTGDPDDVEVEFIATLAEGSSFKSGDIIVASFNAG